MCTGGRDARVTRDKRKNSIETEASPVEGTVGVQEPVGGKRKHSASGADQSLEVGQPDRDVVASTLVEPPCESRAIATKSKEGTDSRTTE